MRPKPAIPTLSFFDILDEFTLQSQETVKAECGSRRRRRLQAGWHMAIEQRLRSAELSQRESEMDAEQRLANGLGWFSIGLGLAEVVAPGRVAEMIGVADDDGTRSLLRFYGMRELAAGVGILSGSQPAGWMWGRVAGDMLDLATLASAMKSNQNDKSKLATATAAVLGVTALDVICAQQLSRRSEHNGKSQARPVHVVRTTTINRPVEDVYRFWRDFQNLPTFMHHLESVQTTGERRSHWKAKAPAGTMVEWDAEIVDDVTNSRISWRSLEGSDVDNSGSVTFERATGGRGTIVKVEVDYSPPGGKLTAMLAKLTGEEPGQQIDADLRRLKQMLEIGEIVRSDASIHRGMHPAQPPQQIPATT